MKLSGTDLRDLYEIAGRNVREDVMHRDETHDQFMARCWINAINSLAGKHGSEVGFIDKSTGNPVLVTLPEHRR